MSPLLIAILLQVVFLIAAVASTVLAQAISYTVCRLGILCIRGLIFFLAMWLSPRLDDACVTICRELYHTTQGAGHEHSMLIVLFEYLGMSCVGLFRLLLPQQFARLTGEGQPEPSFSTMMPETPGKAPATHMELGNLDARARQALAFATPAPPLPAAGRNSLSPETTSCVGVS